MCHILKHSWWFRSTGQVATDGQLRVGQHRGSFSSHDLIPDPWKLVSLSTRTMLVVCKSISVIMRYCLFFPPFFPCSQACKCMHSRLAECREISGCSETHDCASGRQQWQAAHQRGFSLSLCRKVERNNKNKAQTMTVPIINKRIFVFTNSGLGHCKGR